MAHTSVASLVSGAGTASEQTPRVAGRLEGKHILVPLLTADDAVVTDQIRVAAALARTSRASLHVITPYRGLDRMAPEDGGMLTDEDERALAEWATEQVLSSGAGGRFGHARELVSGIRECVRANEVDALVVPSGSVAGRFRRGITERLAVHADCDVITVNGSHGFEEMPSMLLAVADGPHSALATDVARRIAVDCDAWIDILHVVSERASDRQRERASACVEAAAERVGRPDSTTTWVLEAEDVAGAIVEQSAYYGLTVIGAPAKGRLRRLVFGSTNRAIRSDARSVVLSACQRSP